MTYEEAMNTKIDTRQFLTEDDMYMCKHSTVTKDCEGFTVPACTLCNGMACEMVLRYGDEGCKYER